VYKVNRPAPPMSKEGRLPHCDGAVRHLLPETEALHHGGEGGLVVVPLQQKLLAHPRLCQNSTLKKCVKILILMKF
jgi:hypothetical protein